MAELSQRLARLALLASATSLLSYESRALAQIPVQLEPQPAPPNPGAAPPAPVATPPAAVEALPPAPAPPPGAPALPASANVPGPAKAAVITEPEARREAEYRVEADAERDAYAAEEAAAPRSRWYGWQTLASDGVSLTALVVGVGMSSGRDDFGSTLAWSGVLGYEFAPGIVHFAHRNPGRAFASFGLRLGMPLAGAFLGASMASGCDRNLCEASGAALGILLGIGGAIAIDAAVFAYDDRKHAVSRGVELMPLVSVGPRQTWIGVGGTL
jgi:hypothetical protein